MLTTQTASVNSSDWLNAQRRLGRLTAYVELPNQPRRLSFVPPSVTSPRDPQNEWDRQMEADATAGRFDRLARRALSDLAEGKCTDI